MRERVDQYNSPNKETLEFHCTDRAVFQKYAFKEMSYYGAISKTVTRGVLSGAQISL